MQDFLGKAFQLAKGTIDMKRNIQCRLCRSDNISLFEHLTSRPPVEKDIGIRDGKYSRKVYRCNMCSVYFNFHGFVTADHYKGTYNRFHHGTQIEKHYREIMNLPFDQSDNRMRVKRIHQFCLQRGYIPSATKVLDVGSGLGVFLAVLKEMGYECYCLDPDAEAVSHALSTVGVTGAYHTTVEKFRSDIKFDLISFNKVLEHLSDPISSLSKMCQYLESEGVIYIELPDASGALKNGTIKSRQEFIIEHLTIYTMESFRYLARKNGLKEIKIEAIHEPSDKYTLYGFFSL